MPQSYVPFIAMAAALVLIVLRNRRKRTLRPHLMWVVPALVLLGGLPMSTAIGTSLLVIAMKSFAGLSATATTTSGKMRAARRTMSSWPRVMGSKVPG